MPLGQLLYKLTKSRADDVRSFKPDPAIYSYARRVTGAWSSPFWLVSSNPWDIIARSAGLSATWVQRSEGKIYDPWGIEPDVTVRSLIDLPAMLGDGAMLSENPVKDDVKAITASVQRPIAVRCIQEPAPKPLFNHSDSPVFNRRREPGFIAGKAKLTEGQNDGQLP
jgi:hypothetical protein